MRIPYASENQRVRRGTRTPITIEFITSQNDIATFIYAINSIRKSVRLAQVVEQWTGRGWGFNGPAIQRLGVRVPRLTL